MAKAQKQNSTTQKQSMTALATQSLTPSQRLRYDPADLEQREKIVRAMRKTSTQTKRRDARMFKNNILSTEHLLVIEETKPVATDRRGTVKIKN